MMSPAMNRSEPGLRTVRARLGLNIEKRAIHRMSLFCIIESTRRRSRTSGGRSTPVVAVEPATFALARRYSTTEPLVHTCRQNHLLKSIFTVSSTNQNFLDKPSCKGNGPFQLQVIFIDAIHHRQLSLSVAHP